MVWPLCWQLWTTIGVISIILVGNLLIGWNAAVASAPVFAGASVALLIVNQALSDAGLTATIGAIVITIFATQKFIGVPLASYCLQREANSFLKDPEKVKKWAALTESSGNTQALNRPLSMFSRMDKPAINLAKLCLVASLSNFTAQLTKGTINYLVIALIFGIVFTELGFLQKNSLAKTESNFMINFTTIMTVFSSLSQVTPMQLLSNLPSVLIVMCIGSAGVILAGIITGKLLRQNSKLCIALGITCTFGFPTTVLMSHEIADNVGRTKEEVTALENYILPKMTVAGFITVTIGSVILAGLVVPLLR